MLDSEIITVGIYLLIGASFAVFLAYHMNAAESLLELLAQIIIGVLATLLWPLPLILGGIIWIGLKFNASGRRNWGESLDVDPAAAINNYAEDREEEKVV